MLDDRQQRVFTSRKEDESGTNSSAKATIWDLLFRSVCLICRIQMRFKERVWLDRVIVFFWGILMASFALVSPHVRSKEKEEQQESRSLREAIVVLSDIILPAAIIAVIVRVRCYRSNFGVLLRENGRSFKDVGLFVSCMALIGLWHFYDWIKLPRSRMFMSFYYTVMSLAVSALFCIYADIVARLIDDQRNIVASLTRSEFNPLSLMEKKWEIRKRISQTNSIFAHILSLLYLVSFIRILYLVDQLVFRQISHLERLLHVTFILMSPLQLFFLAQRCSAFKSHCMETDKLVLMRVPGGTLSTLCHTDFCSVMRYHDEWDVLRVSYYIHTAGNFITSLATGLTCAAIALQFDDKVIRDLSSMSAEKISRAKAT